MAAKHLPTNRSRTAGFSNWVRRFQARFQRCALILMYHRVVESDTDPYRLTVSPRNFAQHLEILSRYYRVMTDRDLEDPFAVRHVLKRPVMITFDDGYADLLYQAKPLLEQYDLPAIMFITSGGIGNLSEFWWDELERLFLFPGRLPQQVSLTLGEQRYEWELGESTQYHKTEFEQHRDWSFFEDAPPTRRHQIVHDLYRLLRSLPTIDRQNVLIQLQQWAGIPQEGRPSHRTLDAEELVRLASGGLIQIGAHTATHPALSSLSVLQQQEEIIQGKIQLEEIVGHPLRSFAYPYGERSDYTSETPALVQQTGFSWAYANFISLLRRPIDHFQLPRFPVGNWHGEQFARLVWEQFNE